MDELLNSFSKLSITDKTIIQETVKKSDSIEDLVNSFQNLAVTDENISEECKRILFGVIDVLKALIKKEACNVKASFDSPKWIF